MVKYMVNCHHILTVLLPLAAGDGEMPDLSCSGRALSLGISSGTMARGCPRTTAAARQTCLMRGPPLAGSYWKKQSQAEKQGCGVKCYN